MTNGTHDECRQTRLTARGRGGLAIGMCSLWGAALVCHLSCVSPANGHVSGAAAPRRALEPVPLAVQCRAASTAIEMRHFVGWRGLPEGCTANALFGLSPGTALGSTSLGRENESAGTRLLNIDGYYRPLAHVREGVVAVFDGTNPSLESGWEALRADFGTPQARFDWVHSTVLMPAGEWVYAERGLTAFVNPENGFVIHITLYSPTSVENYVQRVRAHRGKRPEPLH